VNRGAPRSLPRSEAYRPTVALEVFPFPWKISQNNLSAVRMDDDLARIARLVSLPVITLDEQGGVLLV
jgi:hypothetical protein